MSREAFEEFADELAEDEWLDAVAEEFRDAWLACAPEEPRS